MDNFILFPNQLFEDLTFYKQNNVKRIILIEDPLFFSDKERVSKFNALKLVYQRATFKFYEDYLKKNKFTAKYYNYKSNHTNLINKIKKDNSGNFHMYYPFDDLLQKRYKKLVKDNVHDNPHFLDTEEDIEKYYNKKKKLFQTSFYKHQREKYDILMNNKGKPLGGKLTYDTDNRESLPKKIKIPNPPTIKETKFVKEARRYVKRTFKTIGDVNGKIIFPLNFRQTKKWYSEFVKNRLKNFGKYQDAFTKKDEPIMFHSGVSPAFNVGFVTQEWIINKIVTYYKRYKTVPLNSVEGVIRQILGWNSFCRCYYVIHNKSINRNKNFFNHKKKLNDKWYTGETCIPPVDKIIKSGFKYGYLHHIERLMVMLNIMLLCEIDFKEIYRWHMEYSLDSYDYLMMYNIYSMGYGDGGLTTTKPYISSSNYIKKMSDFPSGDWEEVWTSLYYNFLDNNYKKLKKNPRMNRMFIHYKNKSKKEINEYKKTAKQFIKSVTK